MICIVCHDAGGAEIISSYVRAHQLECIYALDGPALKIFERKLGKIESLPLESAIAQSDWLLCGTSWQSDLECRAINISKKARKKSVAFLDHWANYRERFVKSGETHLPDEIWVGDTIAEGMAKTIFPELEIRFHKNPYLQDLQQELIKLPIDPEQKQNSLRILYVCEPLREHALREYGNEQHWGYTEEDALRYFLSNLSALSMPVERITIRPHPSEATHKYYWAQKEFNLPIINGGSKTLLEEVANSNLVAGCESMAMVIGLLAGRKVISCIPPGGKPCILPHPEIQHLQNLLHNLST